MDRNQGSTESRLTENANGATTDSRVRHAASHARHTARQKRWNIGTEYVYIAVLSFSGSWVSYAALAFGAAPSIQENSWASVAQLDRASDFGSEGCRFESCPTRQ